MEVPKLCDISLKVIFDFLVGGTTPSTGLLKAIQKAIPNTPIMVSFKITLISDPLSWRFSGHGSPSSGRFQVSQTELDVMIEDIKTFKEVGVLGVVFGILTVGGRVDIERTKRFDTLSDNLWRVYITNVVLWKLPAPYKVCVWNRWININPKANPLKFAFTGPLT